MVKKNAYGFRLLKCSPWNSRHWVELWIHGSWVRCLPSRWSNPQGDFQELEEEICGNQQQRNIIPLLVAAIKACKASGDLERGKKIHADVIQRGDDSNNCVTGTLINMYAKCGSLVDARRVFEGMRAHDQASWTTLMLGYAESGDAETALELFERMKGEVHEVDDRAFLAALKACCGLAVKEPGQRVNGRLVKLRSLQKGMSVHAQVAASLWWYQDNIFITNVLVDMYAKCGSMFDARRVFDTMSRCDVVSWTSLMLGYVDLGESELALDFFFGMRSAIVGGGMADGRTFVAALKACASLAAKEAGVEEVDGKFVKPKMLEKGLRVHSEATADGFDSDLFVASTLVDMYAKCGSMVNARRIFDTIKHADVVTWTALMLGYAESGEGGLALDAFAAMQQRGCVVDPPILAAALKACSNVVNFKFGKILHFEICKCGLEINSLVANCLVDFYCKCGSMSEAVEVFNSLASRDLVTWSALIAGYSRQGDTDQVFDLVGRMFEQGLQADGVTFVSILTACSHAGLTDKGKRFFNGMRSKYGVIPRMEHYVCMVDILGRASELEAAVKLVNEMPYEANALTWRTVLGACRKWKNVVVGKIAFEALIRLDVRNASPYTLMANIYGSLGMWEDQSRVEVMRVNAQAWRLPGKSWWTDETGLVHSFVVGDTKHPQTASIQAKLRELVVRMKEEEGYVADVGSVLHNIHEVDKQDSLCGHSERLAIACALINTPAGVTVRIMKNLRVCDDCHQAIAVVSKIERRRIICRDASRFHVYQDGKCSCADYW